MGFFDKLKKKNNSLAEDIPDLVLSALDDNERGYDISSVDRKAVLMQIAELFLGKDTEALEECRICVYQTIVYAREHRAEYEYRGVNIDTARKGDLKWIGMVNIFIKHGHASELDWNTTDKNIFMNALSSTKGAKKLNFNITLNELPDDGNVTRWCEIIDAGWVKQSSVVGAFDIEHDSIFVIFPCGVTKLSELSKLANQIGRRISYGEIM